MIDYTPCNELRYSFSLGILIAEDTDLINDDLAWSNVGSNGQIGKVLGKTPKTKKLK